MAKKNKILGAMNTNNVVGQAVSFGVGTLDKIIGTSNTSHGLIAFGYNDELGSGAVAVGGQLVSSKILAVDTSITDGAGTITVKYLDQDSSIKSNTFNVISKSAVESLITGGTSGKLDEIDASLSRLNSSVNTLETTDFVQTISGTNAIDATVSGTGHNKTYTIQTLVDSSTVFNTNNKLESLSYKMEAAATATTNYQKTYILYQHNPITGADTSVGVIDIPKDQFLEAVKKCKETAPNSGTYVDEGESGYATATGDDYLHFIWVLNESGEAAAGDLKNDTYIRFKDIAPVYSGDGTYISIDNYVISFNGAAYKTNVIDPIVTNISSSINNINSSIADISTRLDNLMTHAVTDVSLTETKENVNVMNADAASGISAVTATDGLATITFSDTDENGITTVVNVEDLVKKSAIDEIAALLTANENKNKVQDTSINNIESQVDVINTSVNNLENAMVWVQLGNA